MRAKEYYFFNVTQAYLGEHARFDRCITTHGRICFNAKYLRLKKLYRYLKRASCV